MTELQYAIKQSIEAETKKTLGVDVIVEYVPDVNARIEEIINQSHETFNSVYESENFTGTFIPSVGTEPFRILIREKRNQNLDIMSAFHEYQHMIDYCKFLNTVFSGDVEGLKHSPLYVTFNIYSEFSATKAGIVYYGKTVKFIDSPLEDRCQALLETYLDSYRRCFPRIANRYQLLIHTIQYYGCIAAIPAICQEYDISEFFHEIQFINELRQVLERINSFEDTTLWYKEFDKTARKFIG